MATLKIVQLIINDIYFKHNQEYYSDVDMRSRLTEEALKGLKYTRKEDFDNAKKHLIRLFAWQVAFANRLGIDLDAVLWHKYPAICPYCLTEENCVCFPRNLNYDENKPELIVAREKVCLKPASLNDWQFTFAKIYKSVNQIKMFIQVWQHLCEEMGEISRAHRMGDTENLKEEFADGIAQTFAVCTRFGLNLEQIFFEQYGGHCDVCHKSQCECSII